MFLSLVRQRTAFMLAEDPISIMRNQVIDPIAKPLRKDSQKPHQIPNAANFSQQIEYRIRPRPQTLVGMAVLRYQVKGIEVAGIDPVPLEQSDGKIAL